MVSGVCLARAFRTGSWMHGLLPELLLVLSSGNGDSCFVSCTVGVIFAFVSCSVAYTVGGSFVCFFLCHLILAQGQNCMQWG